LAPPLQSQISTSVPLATPLAVTSRHLLYPAATMVPSVFTVNFWA